MIKSFRSRRLKRLHKKGDRSQIDSRWVDKVEEILARLDAATKPEDMDLPGYGFHPLLGDMEGCYAVRVTHNWRVIFRFQDSDACEVDLIDYH